MALSELSPVEFKRFRKYIYDTAGIWLPDHKISLMSNRIRRRLKATGLADFGSYYKYLMAPGHSDELPFFLNEITTNETYFFRDIRQYEWLGKEFLPKLHAEGKASKRSKVVKIWSAACSTGEEPYSIAMCFRESPLDFTGWLVSILATDLSHAVLERAKEGHYAERALQLVKPGQRKRFFEAADKGRWRLKDSVRQAVRFRHHNLLKTVAGAPFDCIFIKNVLIYFDENSKKVVVNHLLRDLARGGYLVVGPSEGIFRMLDSLERIKPWLYRKPK